MDDLDHRNPELIAWWLRRPGRWLDRWHRTRVTGLDRIGDGPVLFVGNHSGGKSLGDGAFLFAYGRRFGPDAPLFALVHRAFSVVPRIRRSFARVGLVPGTQEVGLAALRSGASVIVYPGSDLDAFRPFSDRARVDLGGRTGFVRLAARAGVPIQPVATAGSHETFVVLSQGKRLARGLRLNRILGLHSFPVILCLPWGILLGPLCLLPHLPLPARIHVMVTDPIAVDPALADLPRDDPRLVAAATELEAALQAALTEAYAQRSRRGRVVSTDGTRGARMQGATS